MQNDTNPTQMPLYIDVDQKLHADIDKLSIWSEDAMQTGLSQHDAQNPQGEEEEIKGSELIEILQESQR